MSPSSEFVPLFSVPVISGAWPDSDELDRELERLVLETMEKDGGMTRSNVGGWHSNDTFLEQDVPVLNELRKRIHSLMAEATRQTGGVDEDAPDWSLYGWANVNPRGCYNKIHIHSDSVWSGCYYVRTVSDTNTGAIVFEDTSRVPVPLRDGEAAAREHRIVPQNGQMLLFPSSLPHRVEAHEDDKPRISIAFNLKHPDWALNEIGWIGWKSFLWTHFPHWAKNASRVKQNLRKLTPG